MATLKGQNVRICIYDTTASKYKVIGMSTGCTITLTNNVDNSSHKDVVGMAAMPVTTSKSWQVQVDSLDVADTAAMLTAIKAMQPMTLIWDETSTTDNQTRAKATWARKGQAFLNDATFSFSDIAYIIEKPAHRQMFYYDCTTPNEISIDDEQD